MMALGRCFIMAAVVCLIGLTALYAGMNRSPSRQTIFISLLA